MIKFRAWDKLTDTIQDVLDINFLEKTVTVSQKGIVWYKHDNLRSFEDLILMQSTGLQDKNGVKIFEGDVLRVYEIDDIRGESEYTSPIIWKDYGWLVYDTNTDIPLCLLDRDSDWGDRDVEIEILGNIHANPELLSSGIE